MKKGSPPPSATIGSSIFMSFKWIVNMMPSLATVGAAPTDTEPNCCQLLHKHDHDIIWCHILTEIITIQEGLHFNTNIMMTWLESRDISNDFDADLTSLWRSWTQSTLTFRLFMKITKIRQSC